jgi:hypothetical protein
MNAVEKLFGYGPMTLADVPEGARPQVQDWIRERGLQDDPPPERSGRDGRMSEADMFDLIAAALEIITWHLRSGQRDGLGRLHSMVELLQEETMHRLVEAHPERVVGGA